MTVSELIKELQALNKPDYNVMIDADGPIYTPCLYDIIVAVSDEEETSITIKLTRLLFQETRQTILMMGYGWPSSIW